MEGFLTAQQVAELAGNSANAVHRLANRGTLAFVWMGRQKFFRRDVVERWLADEVAQARRLMVKAR